jgi:putative RNA 2'-phosphotransferase
MKMLNEQQEKRLSKLLSLMLRHEPEQFGLTLDAQGFTPLDDVLRAVQTNKRWSDATLADIRYVVRNSDKQRYEIEGEKIRARYGHSVAEKIEHTPVEPPEILYHGTSPDALDAIKTVGLRSMKRQYVHLSIETEQARIVGSRHHPRPVILKVRAHEAWQNGVKFYQPEARLFLADEVPPQFIEMVSVEK